MLGSINGTSLSVNIKTMQLWFTISETDTQVLGVANKYIHYIVSLFIINFLKQNNYFFIFSTELLIFSSFYVHKCLLETYLCTIYTICLQCPWWPQNVEVGVKSPGIWDVDHHVYADHQSLVLWKSSHYLTAESFLQHSYNSNFEPIT